MAQLCQRLDCRVMISENMVLWSQATCNEEVIGAVQKFHKHMKAVVAKIYTLSTERLAPWWSVVHVFQTQKTRSLTLAIREKLTASTSLIDE